MANETVGFLPAEELSLFCDQIGMILSAGIPLYEGMESLAMSYQDGKNGDKFIELYLSVTKTGQLGDALERSGMFPHYLVSMVRIGERTGKLDDVLLALSRYYRTEAELRKTLRNAVLYPTVLIVMLAAVIAVLVVSVLPIFSRVFASLGLPAASNQAALLSVGVGVGKAALILSGVAILALLVTGLLLRTSRRGAVAEFFCRFLPPLRRAREKVSAGRFADVLSIMLVSGYNLEAAMQLAPAVIPDPMYKKRIETCAASMRAGLPFASSVAKARLFDEMYEKMLTFGAAAGQLDAVMARLSELYREESEESIQKLVSLIEPALVAVLSVVIGGILLSVTLPLLSILSALG